MKDRDLPMEINFRKFPRTQKSISTEYNSSNDAHCRQIDFKVTFHIYR